MQEGQLAPMYEALLADLDLSQGAVLLDVGCGAGGFLELAAKRGARVAGLDASAGMLAVARERLPGATLVLGDLEELPFATDTFDAVTGVNAFQFAATPARTLREAGRVARPGRPVAIAVWGDPEECEAVTLFSRLGELVPPPPPGTPGPFALSAPGALEAAVHEAGLVPTSSRSVACPFLYADLSTALRGLLAAGPARAAIAAHGEEAVMNAYAAALEPFRTPSGGYRLGNVFRSVLAIAA